MLLRAQPGSIFFRNSFSNYWYTVRTDTARRPSSTTCWPTRRSAWNGRRSRRTSIDEKAESSATRDGSGPGCPRINDGSFLFLQHMISKMEPVEGKGLPWLGASSYNGSPLFTGAADSGESNILKWITGERLAGRHCRAAGPALL